MPDAYCGRCGASAHADATSCGRCGGSVAPIAAAGPDPERTFVPDRDAFTVQGASWDASPSDVPYYGEPDPRRPASPSRDPRTAVFVAVGVAAVAVIAVAVIAFVVVRRNDGGTPAAAGSTGARTTTVAATQTPSSRVAAPAAGPATVTVVRSATASTRHVTAPAAQAPRTSVGLRRAYDSATPVDTTPYGDSNDLGLTFTSHSGNIECTIQVGDEDPVSTVCVVGIYDFDQPGPDCDYGAVLTLDGYGNATYSGCASTPFSTSSAELPYGASLSAGEFGCVDSPVGVSCLDLATNTGFTLSRQQFVPVS